MIITDLNRIAAAFRHDVKFAGVLGNQQIIIGVPAVRRVIAERGYLLAAGAGFVADEQSILAVTRLSPE
jgi:hypothetical protein